MNVNQKTCYALSYNYQRPGHFLLSYRNRNNRKNKQNQKIQKEYIGITYLDYKFRNNYFDNPGKLINWFKSNFKKNHTKYLKREKMLKMQQQQCQLSFIIIKF